jgi:hypothetical protein
MSASATGTERDPRKCRFQRPDGSLCNAWSLREGPYCLAHSLSEEEWRAFGRRGIEAANATLREQQLEAGKRPVLPREFVPKIADTIARLLDATIPGSTEANIFERSLGVLLLSRVFAIRADDKEGLRELVATVRPHLVHDPHFEAMLDLKRAAQELRRLYELGELTDAELPPGVFELAD